MLLCLRGTRGDGAETDRRDIGASNSRYVTRSELAARRRACSA